MEWVEAKDGFLRIHFLCQAVPCWSRELTFLHIVQAGKVSTGQLGPWQVKLRPLEALALGQKCSNECQTAEDQFTDDRLRGDFFKIWESPKPKSSCQGRNREGLGKVPNLRKHPWKRTRTQGKDYLYDLPFYMTFPWSLPLGLSSTLQSGASNGSGIRKPSTRRSLAHHVRDPLYMEHFFPMCQTDFLIAWGWKGEDYWVFLPGS